MSAVLLEVKNWLSAQGHDASDAEKLFGLMDSGDQKISAPDLIKAASRLKGPARSIDLHNLMREHDALKNMVGEVRQVVDGVVKMQRKSGTTRSPRMSDSKGSALQENAENTKLG